MPSLGLLTRSSRSVLRHAPQGPAALRPLCSHRRGRLGPRSSSSHKTRTSSSGFCSFRGPGRAGRRWDSSGHSSPGAAALLLDPARRAACWVPQREPIHDLLYLFYRLIYLFPERRSAPDSCGHTATSGGTAAGAALRGSASGAPEIFSLILVLLWVGCRGRTGRAMAKIPMSLPSQRCWRQERVPATGGSRGAPAPPGGSGRDRPSRGKRNGQHP